MTSVTSGRPQTPPATAAAVRWVAGPGSSPRPTISTPLGAQPGLLGELADRGVLEGLARLDGPAGQRPRWRLTRLVAQPQQQPPVPVADDDPDPDHGAHPALRPDVPALLGVGGP